MKKDNQRQNENGIEKPIDLCISAYKHMLKYDRKFVREDDIVCKINSRQFSAELHRMEQEMKYLDFSFLEIEKMDNQLENESLSLYINYLKGD